MRYKLVDEIVIEAETQLDTSELVSIESYFRQSMLDLVRLLRERYPQLSVNASSEMPP